jgi:hypothetical protein
MATHKMQTTQVNTTTAAGRIQDGKETTMITRTTMSSGFGWIGRACIGMAAVAMIGAISIGLITAPRQDAALAVAPSAKAVTAASTVSDRYRTLKLEQAVQRADRGGPSWTQHTIPEQYRSLKARELARRLDQGAVVIAIMPSARPSVRQRFVALEEDQAAQRADAAMALHEAGIPTISLDYRTLKNQQIEDRLAQPETVAPHSAPSRMGGHEDYRTLKERQAMARADSATVLLLNPVSEHYRDLKDVHLQRHLDMGQ